MDLHHDRRAPQSILGFQLSPQRLVGHILQVEVERRDDVEAVHRVLVVPARHPAVKAARDTLAQGFAVAARQLLAVGLLDAPLS